MFMVRFFAFPLNSSVIEHKHYQLRYYPAGSPRLKHESHYLHKKMKKTCLALLFLLVLTFHPALQAQTLINATVDPDHRAGDQLRGLGQFAVLVGQCRGRICQPHRLCNLAFTTLKLNIVRYNIGGGENPNIPDELGFQARIPGFEPSNGVWDWSADANQRWILQAGRRARRQPCGGVCQFAAVVDDRQRQRHRRGGQRRPQ